MLCLELRFFRRSFSLPSQAQLQAVRVAPFPPYPSAKYNNVTSEDHPTAVIARERQSPSFNVLELSHLIWGGEANYDLLHKAAEFVHSDPILYDKESPHDLPLAEHRER